MGRSYRAACGACGHTFGATEGGGFRFESLRCDRCGAGKSVPHAAVWDDYLAMLKGVQPLLNEPSGADWRTYPGEPITKEEYRRRVEEVAGACDCGGRFTFDAPLRCPACRSADVADDGTRSIRFD